jgi:hypothetical protein
MKKMTCKDMSGTCDAEMIATTPEEMMKLGGDHVNTMAAIDPAHAELKKQMDGAMTDPAAMAAWKEKFMQSWASAPLVA